MAYQQSDLDNIRQCIASGVMRTRFADGREVFFQTLSELLTAEQRIIASLAAATPGRRAVRTPAYRNGF
jgi:hypothetical protein